MKEESRQLSTPSKVLSAEGMERTTHEKSKAGVVMNSPITIYHDLDFMVGSWVEDASFDKAMAAQRQVDSIRWK